MFNKGDRVIFVIPPAGRFKATWLPGRVIKVTPIQDPKNNNDRGLVIAKISGRQLPQRFTCDTGQHENPEETGFIIPANVLGPT
ncbi:MAG: hypothetical protein FOGNACKC_00807 [Anaerolineae bacterium]|nr:hypothetical protein [Anaerolineae bacterium]